MEYREAAALLLRQNDILILTHKRPDGDTIGCAAGLCRGLRELGKTAHICPGTGATPIFLPYLEGLMAPGGYQPDTVVSVDIAARGLFTDRGKPWLERGIDLAVDHHPSQEFFARQTCLDAGRAACGELIYDILRELGPVTADMAASSSARVESTDEYSSRSACAASSAARACSFCALICFEICPMRAMMPPASRPMPPRTPAVAALMDTSAALALPAERAKRISTATLDEVFFERLNMAEVMPTASETNFAIPELFSAVLNALTAAVSWKNPLTPVVSCANMETNGMNFVSTEPIFSRRRPSITSN